MANNVPAQVTNKRLWEKLDQLEETLVEYRIASERRLTYLETTIRPYEDKFKKLENWDKGIGIFAAIGSIMAGIFGVNK